MLRAPSLPTLFVFDRRRRVPPTILALALLAGGCVGPSSVLQVAPTEGTRALYRAPLDSLVRHVPDALDDVGQSVSHRSAGDSATTVLVGSKGMTLMGMGEHSRVRARRVAGDTTEVWVVSRPRYVLDHSGRHERATPRVLEAIDHRLGPGGILPFEGLRVRGRTHAAGAWHEGRFAPDGSGGLVVALDDPRDSAAAGPLTDFEVLRGSYSHRSEGAAIGAGIGFIGGLVAFRACETIACVMSAPQIAITVGSLLGLLIGEAVRTHVWTPAAFGPS